MENKFKIACGLLFCVLICTFSLYAEGQVKKANIQFNLEEDDDDFFEEEDTVIISDPLKWFNKPMYHFNDKLYSWFLRPTCVAYKKVIPKIVRGRVRDFFTNLKGPLRVVGNCLQGDLKQSVRETGSFIINTTVGLGGLFDPAGRRLKIKKKSEDFGQVFGKWKIKSGPYLHLPFMGPSNFRDTVGSVFDGFFSTSNYLFPHDFEASIGLRGLKLIDSTTGIMKQVDGLKRDAIDPYSYSRDAWLQFREKQIKD